MQFYLLGIALLIFGCLSLRMKCNKYINIFCICMLSLLLIYVAGERTVGTDYENYILMFNRVKYYNDSTVKFIEPLFRLLITFCSDYKKMFYITAALAVGIKMLFFYKNCTHKYWVIYSYYIYVYFIMDMNMIRQGLSFSFVLWGLFYLKNNDKKRFLIYSLIAVLFHYSALISLLFIFVYRKKISAKNKIIISVISVIFGIFSHLFMPFIVKLFYLVHMNGIGMRIELYNQDYAGVPISLILRWIMVFVILHYEVKKYQIHDNSIEFYMNFFWYAMCITAIGSGISTMIGRITLPFFFVSAILIDYIADYDENKHISLVNMLAFGAYFFLKSDIFYMV